MVDRTGKELKKHQSVDIVLSGVFTGTVIDIKEKSIAVSRNQMAPPQLIIALQVHHVPQDGKHCGVYIVAEPESSPTIVSTAIQ